MFYEAAPRGWGEEGGGLLCHVLTDGFLLHLQLSERRRLTEPTETGDRRQASLTGFCPTFMTKKQVGRRTKTVFSLSYTSAVEGQRLCGRTTSQSESTFIFTLEKSLYLFFYKATRWQSG